MSRDLSSEGFAPWEREAAETGRAFMPRFGADGLLPCIVSDAARGDVLMFAHMNAESLRLTLETGEAHFWSRSRGAIWRKGETSGRALMVRDMLIDCDQDALWLKVEVMADGAVCHLGFRSCFHRALAPGPLGAKTALLMRETAPVFDPGEVYGKPHP